MEGGKQVENRFTAQVDEFRPLQVHTQQNYTVPYPPYAPSPPPPPGWNGAPTAPNFPPYAHEVSQNTVPPTPAPAAEAKGKFDANSLFSMPGKIRNSLQEKFPESIDLSDILLVILLLYLFLDSDDDDMLIILGVLAFTWLWPLIKKEKE